MQALSSETMTALQEAGVSPQAPMLIRAYKQESEFEVWKMRPDGTYVHVRTFPICRWSGQLGPKTHEGDRQSPEGFYSITPAMMNPHSAYYLSFNIGYPNAYDRAHGATGGLVMVHGVCSSAGCFSMTDAQIAEIYALARESFAGGQRAIQMQSYPFHMNAQNLAKYRLDPNMPFWRELKKGHDHFEAMKHDVNVAVCGSHYVFDAKSANGGALEAEAACPPLKYDQEIQAKADERARADDAAVAELVAKGVRPVRLVYQDGAQHPAFAHRIAEVSRPDALVPPVELALDDPNARYNAKARKASSAQAIDPGPGAGAPGGGSPAESATAGPDRAGWRTLAGRKARRDDRLLPSRRRQGRGIAGRDHSARAAADDAGRQSDNSKSDTSNSVVAKSVVVKAAPAKAALAKAKPLAAKIVKPAKEASVVKPAAPKAAAEKPQAALPASQTVASVAAAQDALR